jgi:cyclase
VIAELPHATGVAQVPLAPGVYAYLGEHGMPNAVTVEGRDGVVVIDSLFTPRHAARMIEALRATTDKPVVALVNTHFHGDHVFGNSAIPTDRIIAHRSAHERLATGGDAYRELLCGVRPDLAPEIGDLEFVLPTELIDDRLTLDLGDVRLDIRHAGRHAHTTGDLVVKLPSHGILVASDLVFNGILPVARDGDLDGWIAVLAEQRDTFTGDVVVPGHGAVGGRELFDRQIDVLRGVIEKVTAVLREGGSRDEARAAALTAVGALLHADERIDAYVNLIWMKETNL